VIQARSTFGPHAIGTERSVTVASGPTVPQIASAILQRLTLVQNPDKDEVLGAVHIVDPRAADQ
jgi:hypothetical protein